MRLARLGWLGVLVLALCACSTVSPTLTLAPTRAYVTATPIPPYVAVPAPTLQARVPTLGPTPAWSLPHCDGNGPIGEFERFPALSVRTWVSHQIVVGRVVEQLARAEVDANGQPQTFTYSLIVVEQRVRGQPEVALVLVYQGGTLYPGCDQGVYGERVRLGERRLFFLRRGIEASDLPQYGSVGRKEGAMLITQDESGRDRVRDGSSLRPLGAVLQEIREVLVQPPPAGPNVSIYVPLTEAPVFATPTP